jgi:hypothetical protein
MMATPHDPAVRGRSFSPATARSIELDLPQSRFATFM